MKMDRELDYELAAAPLSLASPPFNIWKENSVAVHCRNPTPGGEIMWNMHGNGP